MGICGEHGGEPSSVVFFAKAGLDYVSCSPFRLGTIISLMKKILGTIYIAKPIFVELTCHDGPYSTDW